MNRNSVKQYYDYLDLKEENPVGSYHAFKRTILYLMTVMNENLLNIVTGIATGLSINVFTNFIIVDSNMGKREFLIWCIRFVTIVILNMCAVKLTVLSSLLRTKARDEADKQKVSIRVEQEFFYRKGLLNLFEQEYPSIKHTVILGLASAIVLVLVNIIYPVACLIIRFSA